MSDNGFFQEQEKQLSVRAEIVSKYFWVWTKVILSTFKQRPNGEIVCIDLFAGPGRFEGDAMSAPLLVLEKAIGDEDLSNHLATLFNDKDIANARS